MYEETKRSKVVKYILIGIALLFVFVMLVLPLVTVICEAFKSGAEVFWQAVSDDYTVKAIVLTVEATVFAVLFNTVFGIFAAWSITKFRFKGKKLLTTLIDLPVTVSPIIAGLIFVLTFGRQSPIYPLLSELGIKVIFAVPGIILATVFVTFPFISRELIPVHYCGGSARAEYRRSGQSRLRNRLGVEGNDTARTYGCKRHNYFQKNNISAHKMGIPLRSCTLCRKSNG